MKVKRPIGLLLAIGCLARMTGALFVTAAALSSSFVSEAAAQSGQSSFTAAKEACVLREEPNTAEGDQGEL